MSREQSAEKSVATDRIAPESPDATVRACEYCGAPYEAARQNQKYCGRPAKCRSRAFEAAHPRRAVVKKRKRIDPRPSCHIRLDQERWAKLGAAADIAAFQSGEPCSRVDVVRNLIDRMEELA